MQEEWLWIYRMSSKVENLFLLNQSHLISHLINTHILPNIQMDTNIFLKMRSDRKLFNMYLLLCFLSL